MLKKTALKLLLKKWRSGSFTAVFWDGDEEHYGEGAADIRIIFRREPAMSDIHEDLTLTLGEAYMNGVIDIEGNMDEILRVIFLNSPRPTTSFIKKEKINADTQVERHNIHQHYDLGNDFFALWLDQTMSYSCAYFKTDQDTLHQAQLQKIDHILNKLNLKEGERLLDIGCGWGWLILRAANRFKVKATGITLSEEQYRGVQQRVREAGMEGLVNVELVSYHDLPADKYQFDKIVSVGMFEHVGEENLPLYMQKVDELLAPGGLSLLHTITGMTEGFGNAWIGKYIFPGGYIPSVRETVALLPEFNFHLLHVENLRLHYARTLDCWYRNFQEKIDVVRQDHDERFVRMWGLYLRACASAFRVGGLDLHQFLFSKGINNQLPMTYDYMYQI